MNCEHCGAPIDIFLTKCQYCGCSIIKAPNQQNSMILDATVLYADDTVYAVIPNNHSFVELMTANESREIHGLNPFEDF